MNALNILRSHWGYSEFRPLQKDIITSVISGQDTIALLPTGGGKSICYQVPALHFSGTTIVISPLRALIQDQVNQLLKRNINASAWLGGLEKTEERQLVEDIKNGAIKLLYVSPEKLLQKRTIELLKKINISLIAIDEAHCISIWGFDFRPKYLELKTLKNTFPNTPIIALTATATDDVLKDIIHQIDLQEPKIFIKSFYRSNLHFFIKKSHRKKEDCYYLLSKIKGSGIIYCSSRRDTQEITRYFKRRNIQVETFHAGLSSMDKTNTLSNWESGKTRVIAATNAFGMGIDKSDVRFVIHYNPPNSLEAFYQEAGRGGRDGKTAYEITLFNENDLTIAKKKLALKYPSLDDLNQIILALKNHSYEDLVELKSFTRMNNSLFNRWIPHFRLLHKIGFLKIIHGELEKDKIQVLCSENVKEFNQNDETVLQHLIRNYESILYQQVPINLTSITKTLGIEFKDLEQILDRLNEQQVISTSIQNKIVVRVNSNSFRFNNVQFDLYHLLKNRDKKRLHAMYHFLTARNCRQQILVKYFGEELGLNCGNCDVCLGSHLTSFRESEKKVYRKSILSHIKKGEAYIDLIVRKYSMNLSLRIESLIKEMEDEGFLEFDHKQIILTSKGRQKIL